MSTAIKPIETRYAGCHFRSRLEARWAVFFDAFDLQWQYELQGFHVPLRLSLSDETTEYLPDFWLPEWGLWVEVKGQLTEPECYRLLNVATSLSGRQWEGGSGNDLVVLGPIPREVRPGGALAEIGMPWQLNFYKGNLVAKPWLDLADEGEPADEFHIASDYGGHRLEDIAADIQPSLIPTFLLNGSTQTIRRGSPYLSALTKARSARFEHGESGPSPI